MTSTNNDEKIANASKGKLSDTTTVNNNSMVTNSKSVIAVVGETPKEAQIEFETLLSENVSAPPDCMKTVNNVSMETRRKSVIKGVKKTTKEPHDENKTPSSENISAPAHVENNVDYTVEGQTVESVCFPPDVINNVENLVEYSIV